MLKLSKRFRSAIGITSLQSCSLRLNIIKTGLLICLVVSLVPALAFADAKSDSDFTSYLNRLEAVRDRALTYAYYLRSAFLRNRVTHAFATGRMYKRARNDIFESVFLLEKSLEYSPYSPALWLEYANLNEQLGRTDKVIQSYEHLVKLLPLKEIHLKLGMLYELVGKPDLAVKQYENAIQLTPDDTILKERVVDVYIQQGFKADQRGNYELSKSQFTQARDKLKQLISQIKLARLWLKDGLLCELLGEPFPALESYNKAISLDPEETDAYIRSSRIYCAMGEVDERAGYPEAAKTNYLKASELMLKVVPSRKSKSELLNFTAYVLALSGEKIDFAEKLVKEALKGNENNSAYIDTLGWILFKKGNIDGALEKILHANDLVGEDPVILDHLGDVYFELGQQEKAREMWKNSLRLDSKNNSVKKKLENCRVGDESF